MLCPLSSRGRQATSSVLGTRANLTSPHLSLFLLAADGVCSIKGERLGLPNRLMYLREGTGTYWGWTQAILLACFPLYPTPILPMGTLCGQESGWARKV